MFQGSLLRIGTAVAAISLCLLPASGLGQGCVCQRQGSPFFGGVNPYMGRGEWQLSLYYRGYESTEHFQGRDPLPALDPNGPNNRQNFFNIDATYAWSRKWSFSIGVPIEFNTFSVRRQPPGGGNRVWVPIRSNGFGDVTVRAKYWLFSTENSKRNVGVSFGVKTPTGKANRTDEYFGRPVPVDVSVQTGDKSWAPVTGLYGFQQLGPITAYGVVNYLSNPRNTTGVPTFFGSLNNPNNTQVNSAGDQYSLQLGGSGHIRPGWPVPSLVYRIEGVPIHDLFGASDGFRRPGTIGFVEPGLSYAIGRHMFSASLGIRSYVNIKDSPTSPRIEDATIPKLVFTAAYSVRF